MLVAKEIGAAARRNIGIGGYGSRLKAGTTKVTINFSLLSSSGLTGRSSTRGLSIHSQAATFFVS
jgi:hypothetical protein